MPMFAGERSQVPSGHPRKTCANSQLEETMSTLSVSRQEEIFSSPDDLPMICRGSGLPITCQDPGLPMIQVRGWV